MRSLTPLLVAAWAVLWPRADGEHGPIRFLDVSVETGVAFRHHHGGTGRRHLPETMGAGAAWLDYDVDGRPDLYFIDSGELPDGSSQLPDAGRAPGTNVLYRQGPEGRFEVAPDVAADTGYGKGVSVADYDGDGFRDIFIGNWGPDVLLRNNGDGTFSDVSAAAGIADPRLSASSAWADFDADGELDLFVVAYVNYDLETAVPCEDAARQVIDYCHPAIYDGQRDTLYLNHGDGTFANRSDSLTGARDIDGKGLALTITDLDDDGRPDVYIANDTTPNFVYFNRDGIFHEEGELTGLGVGDTGQPQAGMGIDFGDVDGDGSFELVVTNFEDEPYNLYRKIAPGFFIDETYGLGLGSTSLPLLGFGVVLADYDADGDLDVSIANGHILEMVSNYPQPNQVLVNRLVELRAAAEASGAAAPPGPAVAAELPVTWRPERDLFADGTEAAGEAISRRRVSRGMATADYDGDGRLDLAVTNVNDHAELLRNVSEAGGALAIRLRGRDGVRDAVGAEVFVTPCADAACGPAEGVSGYPQRHAVKIGASFASQGSTDVVAGLADAAEAHVAVRWPDGVVADLGRLPAGHQVLVIRGQAPVLRRFAPRR